LTRLNEFKEANGNPKGKEETSPPYEAYDFRRGLGLFPFLVSLGVEITKTEGEGRGMLLLFCYNRADEISRRNTRRNMDAELSGRLSCAGNDVR